MSWFSDIFKFGKKKAETVDDSQVDTAAGQVQDRTPDSMDTHVDTAADKAKEYTGTENPPQ
ncbi:MAG TPA: hypothetical protein VFO84_09620 [Dehalococcoidia bacterium]|nr:hypothetical protein [Dehalococcoidia bacterium]